MTVSELIRRLEECDPGARVLLMTQESWPFENDIRGVTVREEIQTGDEDDEDIAYMDDDDDGFRRAPRDFNGDMLQDNDVFIVEGQQLCYGNKDAWNACY